MSLRQIPKRKQTGHVVRRGQYPNVVWDHYLECGHIESRKRRANGTRIACKTCGQLERDAELGIEVVVDLERYRLDQERIIADAFGVPSERVTVMVEDAEGQPRVVDARIDVTGLY